ncbi:MAG: GNAT family N-acetyltransferase [Polyangiaceae bacterium]|nr:GNAT family N-acetyltransferase [Myxococcales bacterium]MCB9584621.1 GNAT family N-acetyltransferase [Polyangiaceae bacterium]
MHTEPIARHPEGHGLARVIGERSGLLPLLRLADDSEPAIAAYHSLGQAFVLLKEEQPLGVTLCTPIEEAWASASALEIKNIAVVPELRARGLGGWMLNQVLEALAIQQVRQVYLATATAGTRQLRFYQRLGFRFLRIERDWFCAERGYADGLLEEGIPLRDRIWLDRVL